MEITNKLEMCNECCQYKLNLNEEGRCVFCEITHRNIDNLMIPKEEELILQGIDLLIYETEDAIENGVLGLKTYRENKLKAIKELKKKIIDKNLKFID